MTKTLSNKQVLKFIARESKNLPEDRYEVLHKEAISSGDYKKETENLFNEAKLSGKKVVSGIRRILGVNKDKSVVLHQHETTWEKVNHKRRLYRLWKRTKSLESIHAYFLQYGFKFNFVN